MYYFIFLLNSVRAFIHSGLYVGPPPAEPHIILTQSYNLPQVVRIRSLNSWWFLFSIECRIRVNNSILWIIIPLLNINCKQLEKSATLSKGCVIYFVWWYPLLRRSIHHQEKVVWSTNKSMCNKYYLAFAIRVLLHVLLHKYQSFGMLSDVGRELRQHVNFESQLLTTNISCWQPNFAIDR